ncbi:hypothetical protein [Wenyingzhuangia sp. IMCC45574]
MNFFNDYKQVIKNAVENDPKYLDVKLRGEIVAENQDYDTSHIIALKDNLPDLEKMNLSLADIKENYNPDGLQSKSLDLGNHPDFRYLRNTNMSEKHWIISGFVDVKNSTKLYNKFTLDTVTLITESIIRASIFAVSLFDGYVHRIQGDGLMVYFGGKNQDKIKSTENALKAFGTISYFVKNDLREFFEDNGIKNIYTRVGLDLGHDKQVKWFYSGIGNTGEVTTSSLHTSLAPKMQAKAEENGVQVGKNIVNQISNKSFFSCQKLIWDYEDGRNYHRYKFDWEKYLLINDLVVQNSEGKLFFKNIESAQNKSSKSLFSIASRNKPYLS